MDPIQTACVPHHLNRINEDELGLSFAHSLQLFFKYSALVTM